MSAQIRIAAKLVGAILLVGLTLFCGYGFLASFEPGFGKFPNVFHAFYGVIGVAALVGAVWLVRSALKWMMTGASDPHWANYCRLYRLAALFSLFSVIAFMTGHFVSLSFLGFLLFLLPIPAKPRTQP